MKYIGLISDTHSFFDDKVRKFLEDVDEVWHAGDIGNLQTAAQIADFKPLKAVFGNCDDNNTRLSYPLYQLMDVEGAKVLMMHIGGYPGKYDYHALQLIERYHPNIFICGHSHILKVMNDKRYNMLAINPGAAGLNGFHLVRTAIRFHIADGKITDMEVGEWEREYRG